MGSRRQFLVGLFTSGLGLGLAPTIATGEDRKRPPDIPAQTKGYFWKDTIFCQAQDARLLADVHRQAWHMGLDLILGRPDAPDIFARPYFVAIIDRTTVPYGMWSGFLKYREEFEEQKPILVVDGKGSEAPFALDASMQMVDPGSEEGKRQIMRTIRTAHEIALKWEPEFA